MFNDLAALISMERNVVGNSPLHTAYTWRNPDTDSLSALLDIFFQTLASAVKRDALTMLWTQMIRKCWNATFSHNKIIVEEGGWVEIVSLLKREILHQANDIHVEIYICIYTIFDMCRCLVTEKYNIIVYRQPFWFCFVAIEHNLTGRLCQ